MNSRVLQTAVLLLYVLSVVSPAWASAAADKAAAEELLRKADGYVLEGRLGAARADYERAIKLGADLSNDYLRARNLGFCYMNGTPRDLRKAAQWFELAWKLRPEGEDVRLSLAQSLAWSGQHAAAVPHYRALVEKHPNAADLILALGSELYWAGQHDEAWAVFDRFLERFPTNTSIRVEYARLLSYARLWPRSTMQYEAVLQADPNNVQAQVGLAKLASWQNDHKNALDRFDRILKRHPRLYDAIVGKAYTLYWMGQVEQAKELFLVAYKRNPRDKDVLATLKEMGADPTRKPEPAKPDVTVAQKPVEKPVETATAQPPAPPVLPPAPPRDPVAELTEQAQAAADRGNHTEAIHLFHKALELRPQDAAIMLQIARVLSWARSFEASARQYQEVLDLEPTNLQARLERARVLSWNQQYEEAIAEYNKVLADATAAQQQPPQPRPQPAPETKAPERPVATAAPKAPEPVTPQPVQRAGAEPAAQPPTPAQPADVSKLPETKPAQPALAPQPVERAGAQPAAQPPKPSQPADVSKLPETTPAQPALAPQPVERAAAQPAVQPPTAAQPADVSKLPETTPAQPALAPQPVERAAAQPAAQPPQAAQPADVSQLPETTPAQPALAPQPVERAAAEPAAQPPAIDMAATRLELARVLAWSKRYDESIAQLNQLLPAAQKPEPKDKPVLIEKARILAWSKQYEEALATYDVALELDPADLEARLGKGQALYWSGRLDQAAQVLRPLMQVQELPSDSKSTAALTLAGVEYGRGRNSAALHLLDATADNDDSKQLRRSIREQLRPVLRVRFGWENDQEVPSAPATTTVTRVLRFTESLEFNLTPDVRMEVTNRVSRSTTSNGLLGQYGSDALAVETMARLNLRVNSWLEMIVAAGEGSVGRGSTCLIPASCLTPVEGPRTHHFVYDLHPIIRKGGWRIDIDLGRHIADYTPLAIHNNVLRHRVAVAASYNWRNRVLYGGEFWHADYTLESPQLTPALARNDFATSANGGSVYVTPTWYRGEHVTIDAGVRYEKFTFDHDAVEMMQALGSGGFFTPREYQRFAGTAHMLWEYKRVRLDLNGTFGPQQVTGFRELFAPPAEWGTTGSVGAQLGFNFGRFRPYIAYDWFNTATPSFPGQTSGSWRSHSIVAGFAWRF